MMPGVDITRENEMWNTRWIMRRKVWTSLMVLLRSKDLVNPWFRSMGHCIEMDKIIHLRSRPLEEATVEILSEIA